MGEIKQQCEKRQEENDPTYELYNTLQQLKYQTSTSIWLSREIDKNTGLWYFVIVIPTFVMTLLVHHDFLKHFPIGEQYYPFILVLSIVALSVVLFMLYFRRKGLSFKTTKNEPQIISSSVTLAQRIPFEDPPAWYWVVGAPGTKEAIYAVNSYLWIQMNFYPNPSGPAPLYVVLEGFYQDITQMC
jgi:hypothetical protein